MLERFGLLRLALIIGIFVSASLPSQAADVSGPTLEEILAAQPDYTSVEIRGNTINMTTRHSTRYTANLRRYWSGKTLLGGKFDPRLVEEVWKALEPKAACRDRGYSCPPQFDCNVLDEVKDIFSLGTWILYYECIPDASSCENGCVAGYEIPEEPVSGEHSYACKPAERFSCVSAAPGAQATVYHGIPGYACMVQVVE